MTEKLRFKSEYKNIPDTGNWLHIYEEKKHIYEQFFFVYTDLFSITRPSVFLLQANCLWTETVNSINYLVVGRDRRNIKYAVGRGLVMQEFSSSKAGLKQLSYKN